MESFSLNPPINDCEDEKCILGVTRFEATNSVFNTFVGNISFYSIPRHCASSGGADTFNKLQKILELTSENDIE